MACSKWVGVDAVAEATGRKRRAVQLWAKRAKNPCPHRRNETERGSELEFQMDAVYAWLDGQGMDRTLASTEPAAPPRNAPRNRATKPVARARARKPDDSPPSPHPPPLPEQPTKPLDAFEELIRQAEDALRQVFDKSQMPGKSATAAERGRWAAAFKAASGEYRQLRRDFLRDKEISALWIHRDIANAIVTQLADLLVGQLVSLPGDGAAKILLGMLDAELVTSAQAEKVRRVAIEVIEALVADRRERIAAQLREGGLDDRS